MGAEKHDLYVPTPRHLERHPPVTYRAPGEMRYFAAEVSSSNVPERPIGKPSGSDTLFSMMPGEMTFTVTPFFFASTLASALL